MTFTKVLPSTPLIIKSTKRAAVVCKRPTTLERRSIIDERCLLCTTKIKRTLKERSQFQYDDVFLDIIEARMDLSQPSLLLYSAFREPAGENKNPTFTLVRIQDTSFECITTLSAHPPVVWRNQRSPRHLRQKIIDHTILH